MECQIRSMAEARISEDKTVVPEGRVEKMCKEWLVREDSVLAYRLQSQEINHHYDKNRENSQLVRSDLKEAKTAQQEEEEQAVMVKQAYERMLQEQAEEDARLALALQEQLQREVQLKERLKDEDERLAHEMHVQEAERKLNERRAREARKGECLSHALQRTSLHEEEVNGMEEVEKDTDFSDFCLQPPPGLNNDEIKRFQEEQDAELAFLLQEQESKRRGLSLRDRQLAIEAQDRELARLLQEQERARARKAREKAKQKALLQQQQQQQEMDTIEELTSGHLPPSQEELSGRNSSASRRGRDHERQSEDEGSFLVGPGIKNIAVDIDPTFQRRKASLEMQGSSNGSSKNTPVPSPMKSTVQTLGGSTSSPALSNGCYDLDDCEGAVPPYMPIQGQRRSSSLEKTKKRKSKDGCKQQ